MSRKKFLVSGGWLAGLLLCAADAHCQSLVKHTDLWHYKKGTSAAQGDWKVAADAGLDASWLSGVGGFGYADNASETQDCGTLITDMENKYRSIYLRKTFEISQALDPQLHLKLSVDFDDGFIAWLDGSPLTNRFVTGAPAEPGIGATANASHEASHGNSSPQSVEVYDLGAVGKRLAVGKHVLALMALNNSVGSSDLVIVPDLFVEPAGPVVTNCWSGLVSGKVVWGTNSSPVHVCGALTVGAGAELRIEAGVRVEMDSGVAITVEDGGVLLAEGTETAPILFTRSGTSGRWKNLTLKGSVGSPESRIVHAKFEFNVDSTGTPCIEVAAGTAFLDHLDFANTASPYIHVDGASFVISHCRFPQSTASFELCHGTGGVKQGGHGLFYRNYFGKASGYNDVVDFTGGNRPSQPIVHFIENVLMGADDDGFDLDGTDAWVEGNIFLRFHKNGGTPDSSSAVSGGNDSTRTSEMTVLRNLFVDCDTAATAKQGNFCVFKNNTVLHQTHVGGVDTAGGVLNVRDVPSSGNPTTFGRGFYAENNVIWDAEQLVRNYDAAVTTVTFIDNVLPSAWAGPGKGNVVGDPHFKKVPALADLDFGSWEEAQVLWDWLSVEEVSPAKGQGEGGTDSGAVIPQGVILSGVPLGSTTNTTAEIHVGWNRTGNGIPADSWAQGSGYVGYRYRVDGGEWSALQEISSPISLSSLSAGDHYVEVNGRRDSGLDQDDTLFGELAGVTRSATWTVEGQALAIEAIVLESANRIKIRFSAQANAGYTIYRRESLSEGDWQSVIHVDPLPTSHVVEWPDEVTPGKMQFYRVSSP